MDYFWGVLAQLKLCQDQKYAEESCSALYPYLRAAEALGKQDFHGEVDRHKVVSKAYLVRARNSK